MAAPHRDQREPAATFFATLDDLAVHTRTFFKLMHATTAPTRSFQGVRIPTVTFSGCPHSHCDNSVVKLKKLSNGNDMLIVRFQQEVSRMTAFHLRHLGGRNSRFRSPCSRLSLPLASTEKLRARILDETPEIIHALSCQRSGQVNVSTTSQRDGQSGQRVGNGWVDTSAMCG